MNKISTKIKKTSALLLALIMCFSLCGCETWRNFRKAFIDPPEPIINSVKIGVFEPTTGRQSYDAEDEIAGMEIAHKLFPTVLDYDVELIYEDNRSNNEVCVSAAQTLADKGCAVILGSVSDTLSLAASDTVRNAKIPAISATNTVPILTQTNYYYFRVSYINTFDAEGASDYAFNILGADKCAVFLPKSDDYSAEKASRFESDFVKRVGQDSFEITLQIYDEETRTYSDHVFKRPTVKYIYLTGEETDDSLLRTFKDLDTNGYTTIFCLCGQNASLPLIKASQDYAEARKNAEEQEKKDNAKKNGVTDNADNKDEENGGEDAAAEGETEDFAFSWIGTESWHGIETAAEQLYGSTDVLKDVAYTIDYDPMAEQTEISRLFLDAYHQEYGANQDPSDACALGFDAYLLAITAVQNCQATIDAEKEVRENAGKDPDTESSLFNEQGQFNRVLLTSELYKIRDMQGVTGKISIDSNGDPVKDIYIRRYDGQSFNVIYASRPELPLPEDAR